MAFGKLEIDPEPRQRPPCRACQDGPIELIPEVSEDGLCAGHAAELRLYRLAGYVEDDHEMSQWVSYLLDLGDPDLGSDTVDMEDAQEVDGLGWIEDTHGRAVFVPYCPYYQDEDEL